MAQNGKKVRGGRKNSAPPAKEKIAFDYVKSNYFRVISVNGVVGGVAPNGGIHMAVWSQRQPYPRQVIHSISVEGKLGEELGRTVRETDIIREVEAALVFDAGLARAMIKWLQTKLVELEGVEERRKGGDKEEETAE